MKMLCLAENDDNYALALFKLGLLGIICPVSIDNDLNAQNCDHCPNTKLNSCSRFVFGSTFDPLYVLGVLYVCPTLRTTCASLRNAHTFTRSN